MKKLGIKKAAESALGIKTIFERKDPVDGTKTLVLRKPTTIATSSPLVAFRKCTKFHLKTEKRMTREESKKLSAEDHKKNAAARRKRLERIAKHCQEKKEDWMTGKPETTRLEEKDEEKIKYS